MKWVFLSIAALMYAFVVIFPERKSLSALGAAAVVLVLSLFHLGGIRPDMILRMIDWNILLIFIGSLVIAELFIYSKVPALIADTIIEKSPDTGLGMVLLLVMTGFISALVENVATVLVMAPIALALCNKLKMNPTYFMTGLAVMANMQGTATLVGDPPSMIFADYSGYGFNDFFMYHGKPSIFFAIQAAMIAGAVFFYGFFKKTPRIKVEVEKEKVRSWVPAALLILMTAGLAIASFVTGSLTIASGIIVAALAIAGIGWYKFVQKQSGREIVRLIKNLDWDTTLFLVGIFVVIGAVTKTGLLNDFALFLSGIIGTNVLLGFVLIAVVSVVISGFIDNVPYIIAMLPVAGVLARQLHIAPELYMFTLLIGSCLGGNLTCFGASANIVTLGLLRKSGTPCNFVTWLKIGAPFTILTTAVASLFVWLVWS